MQRFRGVREGQQEERKVFEKNQEDVFSLLKRTAAHLQHVLKRRFVGVEELLLVRDLKEVTSVPQLTNHRLFYRVHILSTHTPIPLAHVERVVDCANVM